MSRDDSLISLLDLLVRVCPDPASARVVAEKAGLSTRSLPRVGDVRGIWLSILRDARQSETGLRDLARVAGKDRPDLDFLALVRPVEEISSSHEHGLATGHGLDPTAEADLLAHLHEGIVHPLPPAPLFVGRVEELDAARGFWRDAAEGPVLALIGLGGAGKTAIASALVSGLLDPAAGEDRPDGLFVWSFYVDQDVSNFLRHAYRYFSRGLKPESSGAGLLYRLAEMLDDGGRNLLVLDGLERVQRPPGDLKRGFGELDDPLLRQAITRLAAGVGRTKCLITTRFPVPDLAQWEGRGYARREVNQLDRQSARQLLRRHGVRGGDGALDAVLDEYGSHALTLDHVGAYLAAFHDGDPAAAAGLEEPRLDSYTPEERKLARVLRAYEKSLSPRELDLLARFCLFRTGASSEALHAIFSRADAPALGGDLAGCTEAEFGRLASRLAGLHLLLPEPGGGYTAHPAVRDHFYRIFTDASAAHRVVGEKLMSDCGLDMARDWEEASNYEGLRYQILPLQRSCASHFEVIRLNLSDFSGRLREFLSRHGPRLSRASVGRIDDCIRAIEDGAESIPLPALEFGDGRSYTLDDLRDSRWEWRRRSVLWPVEGESDACEDDKPPVERLSWSSKGDAGSRQPHEDWLWLLEYEVVLDARKKLTDQLRGFVSRHGPRLSRASVGRIDDCIRAIEDGAEDFEIPDLEPNTPGVTLRFRPGSSYPEDPGLLDALEEVIYHTVRSGNGAEAYDLYSRRMGGREHLGKVIGEFARGARILRYFPSCPNELDLAWYLRGVGDLRASYDLLSKVRPIWSGTVLCLRGFLPRVVREKIGWEHTQVIAAFLMGRPEALEPKFDLGWGEALVNADLYLMKGELARARAVAASDLKNFKAGSTHVPEQVRTRLVLAEVKRREGRTGTALAGLEREAPWILRSGSVEHLSLYQLIRSRALADRGEYEAADSESREGLILTRQCGLGLAHVDFLNLRSRLALARARSMSDQDSPKRGALLEDAARSALGALNGIRAEDGAPAPRPDVPFGDLVALGARHPECQYAWGAADALTLLGEVLAEQGRPSLARDALREAVALQSTLRHPDLARTEVFISRLEPRG